MAKVNITYSELKRSAANMLTGAGTENPNLDVRLLLEKASHKTAAELIACERDIVPEAVQTEFHELLGCRLAHEPIAYIFGEKAFWSLDFKVDENVLIPRPETEGLVERALELISAIPKPQILDIGTGSGAVIISLLHERRTATGLGVDISPEALDIARINADRHNIGNRCRFARSDYLSGVSEGQVSEGQVSGKFDIIVSNPPYIDAVAMENLAPDVELYEPELALYGGKDGLDAYRAIIAGAKDVLAPDGHLIFEIGFDQKTSVCALLRKAGATKIRCQQDLAGLDRIISATFC
jgi:release factor glutamine methyltransferase